MYLLTFKNIYPKEKNNIGFIHIYEMPLISSKFNIEDNPSEAKVE